MIQGFPGNIGNVLEQAKKLQEEFTRITSEAEKKEVQASAGGGMVVVTVNGAGLVTSIKIDKSVVDVNDIEMLQDLVRAAVNEGTRRSKEIVKEELKKVSGGLPIPGLSSLL